DFGHPDWAFKNACKCYIFNLHFSIGFGHPPNVMKAALYSRVSTRSTDFAAPTKSHARVREETRSDHCTSNQGGWIRCEDPTTTRGVIEGCAPTRSGCDYRLAPQPLGALTGRPGDYAQRAFGFEHRLCVPHRS